MQNKKFALCTLLLTLTLLPAIKSASSGETGSYNDGPAFSSVNSLPVQAADNWLSIPTTDRSMHWFNTQNTDQSQNDSIVKNNPIIKGVALVIHGLNLKPDKMTPVINHITVAGIDVLNLSLFGHGTNYHSDFDPDRSKARMTSFKQATYSKWQNETYKAYLQAKRKSEKRDVPLFFIGYSLGGLLGNDLLVSFSDVRFDRAVLFAPALSIRSRSYALKSLAFAPGLVIPSFSPKSYQANQGTPVAAYNAMFDAISHFHKNQGNKLNIPTLIFIDIKDELVSYKGLKKIKEDEHLEKWRFHMVKKEKNDHIETIRHLIIDKNCVGSDMWEVMMDVAVNHLLSQ